MNTIDMTKGSIPKHILAFALPVFLSSLFQQLYNIVDSLIVGNFIGKEALAAVSSSGSLIFLFTSFIVGTATGAGVLISKYFGEKNYEELEKAIHTDIALGLIASLIMTGVGIIFSPILLKLMKTDPNVLPSSIIYFRNYFIGSLGIIMYSICNGILQALGNSKRPLYYLIFSSILNVVLDLLFIAVFKMGVGAASIATGISQLASAILCFCYLLKKDTIYQVKINKIRIDKKSMKLILKYGLPSGVQNSVIALANVLVQSNINSFGEDAMAGCGTYQKLEGFGFLPVTAFTMALTTFIGQNLGAEQFNRAKKGARFGIICSVVLAEVLGLVLFIGMPLFSKLFSSDPAVNEIAVKQARTVCLFYFLLAFSHCVASICRGAGKAVVPMVIMLSVWCVFRVIYISIAMKINHDIVLLVSAYPLTWAISSLIYLFYFEFGDWLYYFKKKKEQNID